MGLRRWFIVLAASLALVGAGVDAPAQADETANGPVFTVMNTSETPPDGVWFRNSPHTSDTDRVTGHGVYMGERVQLRCYAWGDAVGAFNNSLWYRVLNVSRPANGGVENSGFLNAHYIDDGLVANQIDAGVPDCSATAALPTLSLAQGPVAPAGYRYAITLDHFAASSSVSITCYDSVSPGGFYTFNLGTDGSGHASTASYCYSGDGPDHWVTAGGAESNHVSWGASSAAQTVSLAQGTTAPAGYRYAITLDHFAAGSSVSVSCYDSVSPSGFYTFSLGTDGSGHASTASYCYSGDGPDHWVTAGGVESNHVSWGASSGGGTGGSGTGGGSAGGGGTGGGGTSSGGTGFTACNIRLQRTAGAREKQLAGMTSDLNAGARAAGIKCQTLAHIIYHEGGNYLSIRRSATQLAELSGAGASVGIGQMKVSTAKLVAIQVFQDWETASDEDLVVRTNLIYDLPYAVKYAAGYVAVMEKAGIAGDFQLFMSYSLNVKGAQAWRSTGYSMNRAKLSTIPNLNVDVFIKRKTFYDQAVKAIG